MRPIWDAKIGRRLNTMGLIMQRQEGGAQIPPGEKLRFGIQKAVEDWGDHGPQARYDLVVLDGEHKGATLTDWSKLAQPRLDFVGALRNKNYDDETIADILRKRGFEFEKIDEPEDDVRVSEGGKTHRIVMGAFKGDTKTIDSFKTIGDLLAALEGKSIVAVTKARGKDGKYTGLVWDMIYPDGAAEDAEVDNDEDFEDIPF